MVADMAADCVIGVDLGGTKVLAGAVDSDHQVHHRAQRLVQLAEELARQLAPEARGAVGRAAYLCKAGLASDMTRWPMVARCARYRRTSDSTTVCASKRPKLCARAAGKPTLRDAFSQLAELLPGR